MSLKNTISILFLSLFVTLFSMGQVWAFAPAKLPLTTTLEAYSLDLDSQSGADNAAKLLVLTLDMEKDWYTYSEKPTEMGKPTTIKATAQDGTKLVVIYPKGKEKPDSFDPSITITAFNSGTHIYIVIPPHIESPYPVSLTVDMLLCHPTKCLPARMTLTYAPEDPAAPLPSAVDQKWWPEFITLSQVMHAPPDEDSEPVVAPEDDAAVIDWQFDPVYLQPGLEVSGLISAVLMGLLAGLILNVMPCVLPVVSLKLSAILGAGAEDDEDPIKAFRMHNVFFVLGVLSFFLFLAVVLGATGKAWGALFQYQWLVVLLAAIMGALGMSLFGLFHLPIIDLKFDTGQTNPHKQAFFTGMLTTLLATPCSGPFLGGVLGWALIQGPIVIATVFLFIGLGMSIPYLILIASPGLARFLPRSGPWIEYVEKGIGFFLMGTAFYLLSIAFGSETLRVLAPLWVVIVGAWFWVRSKTFKPSSKWIIRLCSVALLALAVVWTTPTEVEDTPWATFDPISFQERLGQEDLFVEFTADWCPTCKVLEATVMTDENVTVWKEKYGLTFIRVDMTERDPESEALLNALGSHSIPTAAIFKRGEDAKTPLVLRDLYTEDQLVKILKSL